MHQTISWVKMRRSTTVMRSSFLLTAPRRTMAEALQTPSFWWPTSSASYDRRSHVRISSCAKHLTQDCSVVLADEASKQARVYSTTELISAENSTSSSYDWGCQLHQAHDKLHPLLLRAVEHHRLINKETMIRAFIPHGDGGRHGPDAPWFSKRCNTLHEVSSPSIPAWRIQWCS